MKNNTHLSEENDFISLFMCSRNEENVLNLITKISDSGQYLSASSSSSSSSSSSYIEAKKTKKNDYKDQVMHNLTTYYHILPRKEISWNSLTALVEKVAQKHNDKRIPPTDSQNMKADNTRMKEGSSSNKNQSHNSSMNTPFLICVGYEQEVIEGRSDHTENFPTSTTKSNNPPTTKIGRELYIYYHNNCLHCTNLLFFGI